MPESAPAATERAAPWAQYALVGGALTLLYPIAATLFESYFPETILLMVPLSSFALIAAIVSRSNHEAQWMRSATGAALAIAGLVLYALTRPIR